MSGEALQILWSGAADYTCGAHPAASRGECQRAMLNLGSATNA